MRKEKCPDEYRYITVLFDREDASERRLLAAFQDSFGDRHADTEVAYPPRHLCLHLYPGGALELER
jgi:hypothetical protein